jgi:hypothetical protein
MRKKQNVSQQPLHDLDVYDGIEAGLSRSLMGMALSKLDSWGFTNPIVSYSGSLSGTMYCTSRVDIYRQ